MWLVHPKFREVCKEWWEAMVASGWEGVKIMEKWKRIRSKLKVWTKAVFGDIKVIKESIMDKIE
ncbi:hypothetical protein, partial [Escherichia coli]|uniref:hypothetical protein n=1 Tax=Escherichia coli TaxID=562 RepID=UPI002243E21B